MRNRQPKAGPVAPRLRRGWAWSEAVAFLLGHGADPDARGRFGQTPLFPAVASGSEAAVRHLLDAGVDPAAADEDGDTPLEAAVRGGDPRIIRLLLPATSPPE